MMRFSPNLKKVLLIGTVVLVGCDISMLFAAPASSQTEGNNLSTNPQLQQLQAQIQAMQNQSAGASGTDAVGTNVATQILGNQQQQTDNILPPSPFSENPTNQLPRMAGTPKVNTASDLNAAVKQAQSQSQEKQALALQALQRQQLLNQQPQSAVPTTPQNASTSQSVVNASANQSAATDSIAQTPFNQQIALPSSTDNGQNTNGAVSVSNSPASSMSSSQGSGSSSSTVSTPSGFSDDEISDAAFNAMLKNALPLTPDQIQTLRSKYMEAQFAASSSPVTPPRPTATSQFVDLSPGATPPAIRLAQGFVTSLVFVDSTGAPWPIQSYDIGNPSAFNIQWDKSSNTLMIQSSVLYSYGNLAIRLRGLDTPVMLTLIPGQKAVDYRVDLRVQGLGPDAKPLPMSTIPASTSTDLLNVLDGVPPANSKAMKVQGGDCQAWLSGSTMYVRTRLNILSPGWIATLSSADGMHAYQMQPTPMLLVSQNGQVLQLKVEGF